MILPRVITESGRAGVVAGMVSPVLETMGFQLVRVHLSGRNGGTAQIMAEPQPTETGTSLPMRVEGCSAISRQVAPLLEAASVLDDVVHFEVSSPGLDRPLVRTSDFRANIGSEIRVVLTTPTPQGQTRLRGTLMDADSSGFVVRARASTHPADESAIAESDPTDCPTNIRYDAVASAKLMLPNELLRRSPRGNRRKNAPAWKDATAARRLAESASHAG